MVECSEILKNDLVKRFFLICEVPISSHFAIEYLCVNVLLGCKRDELVGADSSNNV